MPFLPKYRFSDILPNLAVALLYVILAKIGLFFALQSPAITIFWPAGGLALAALLIGGLRYLPGIFTGAVVAGLMAVDTPWVATMLGVADTVESFVAFWLLTRKFNFNPALEARQDFFKLTPAAACIASAFSALIGAMALWLGQIIPAELFPTIALRWWMGDVLGIAFITPLILLWRRPPKLSGGALQAAEWLALFSLTAVVGQIMFFDWHKDFSYAPQGIAWLVLMVIWAGLRAGRHNTAILQLFLFIELLWSASHETGRFANDMVQSGLVNFWMFGMVLAAGGMALAVMSDESRRTGNEWHRLHESISASLNEIYLFDAITLRYFYVNQGARGNLGYSMEELATMRPLDLAPHHTEESFQARIQPLLQHEKSLIICEGIHKRKNGTLYPVEVHLQLFETPTERYFQAVILDITERLATETELRLAAQVFESSMDGIVVTDQSNRIVAVNSAYTRITGYTEGEVKGRNPNIVSSGKHDVSFYHAMWNEINREGHWQGEIWNRRKNGEIFPEWMKVSVIRNTQGAIVNHVGVFSDITERKASETTLLHQAMHDFLTNLPNRVLFHDRFQQLLARSQREKTKFALLYLDLDDFKPVNDTYGHRIGDLLLQEVAARLTEVTRQTDTICRQGGDEFAILIPGIESEAEAESLIQKLRSVLEQSYDLEGIELRITASIGLAIYPDSGENEETLMERADEAMYQAKRQRTKMESTS